MINEEIREENIDMSGDERIVIDSVNLVVEGVERLDRNYLGMVLGVKAFFPLEIGKRGFSFTYNDIIFRYYELYKNLEIRITTHKLLDREDIYLSDKEEIISKIQNSLNEVLQTKGIKYKLKLVRIDYCIDLRLGEELVDTYMKVLHKHRSKFQNKRRIKSYDTSNYLPSQTGITINIYDKEEEIKAKGEEKINKIREQFADDEKIIEAMTSKIQEEIEENLRRYKGVLRVEIQFKKDILKERLKASYRANKKAKKEGKDEVPIIPRKIDNYWSLDSMKKSYFELLKKYVYEGNYYKYDIAIQKIQDSDEKDNQKERLIEFVKSIKEDGIDKVMRNSKPSAGTKRKYISKLNELNINPIMLDDDSEYDELESIYILVVEEAKKFINRK